MVHSKSIDLSPTTSRFTMDSKTPNSPSIEASSGTNHILATNHEDHRTHHSLTNGHLILLDQSPCPEVIHIVGCWFSTPCTF